MRDLKLPKLSDDLTQPLSESDFHKLWVEYVDADASAHDKAWVGGYCADQPGWIFAAGYQAAIAYTFPETGFADWAAFAVSEDRTAESPLPGLTSSDGQVISGFKTWIATSRHSRALIVSYQYDEQRYFRQFAIDCPGITVTHKDAPGLLPDLSQGVAEFSQVELSLGTDVDTSRIAHFGQIEGFFVLVSMLACLQRFARHAQLGQLVDDALSDAQSIAMSPQTNPALAEFKTCCRDLLREVRSTPLGQQPLWQRDGKLLAGYAR